MYRVRSYQKQETIIILLNLAVLAALFFTHIGFISLLGRPSQALMAVLSVRFIILVLELIWLQKLDPSTSARMLDLHTHFSVWINIALAFIASYFGGTADSHYSVLMIIPIITAAYRYTLLRTLGIVAVAVVLTILEVWLYFERHPPSDFTEYFEAATVSLIFVAVALIVWLLVGNLRGSEQRLQESLDELRRMQEKLLAEEKLAALGQLSSAIAHEIRNPVAMITSSLEMARKQPGDSPVREEMFDIAAAEARRLGDLTGDFLSYARSRPPVLREVPLHEVLGYLADISRAKLAEKDLRMEIRCDERLTGELDSDLIRQALLNLVMNAADASPAGGRIVLGAESEGKELKIFVTNEGRPVGRDDVTRIFEPFFTGRLKGTGLGLSIVRNIARAHGGDVRLAENNDGAVRFEIVLPGGVK